MDVQEPRYTEKQAKRILKDAFTRQYSTPNESRINPLELTELATEAGISEDNLNRAVQEYTAKKSRRNGLTGLAAKVIVLIAGLTGLTFMVKGSVNSIKAEKEYVNSVILNESGSEEVTASGEMNYRITFKVNDNTYFATVVPRQGTGGYDGSEFRALREAISEGSKIGIKRKALNRFNGISGMLVYDEIKVLEH